MPRPAKQKIICFTPETKIFKPAGIPMGARENITLSLDEFEAIRLADNEGLYQDQAAGIMGTSRQTFARILDSAHKKVAMALVEARPLVIEGGNVRLCGRGSCQTQPGCPRMDQKKSR